MKGEIEMDKRERKMTEEQLQMLLHMRHREKTHTPKKGKGSYNRQQFKKGE